MRRTDRQVTDMELIYEIIKKCDVCNIAFFDDEFPYIVPLNFGVSFADNKFMLYFHGAGAGKKLELLKKNNKVAFEMDRSRKLIPGEKACDFTMEFESVCGNGVLEIVPDKEKIEALQYLMKQYSSADHHEFNDNEIKATVALKLTVYEISAKRLKHI